MIWVNSVYSLVLTFDRRHLGCEVEIQSVQWTVLLFNNIPPQQAPDVYVTSGWRCILVEKENRVDISIWRQFDVDLTLDFGYTT